MLQKPLEVKFKHIGKLLHAIFRIHNFYITMRLQENPFYDLSNDEDFVATSGIAHVGPQPVNYLPSNISQEIPVESDVVRNALLHVIRDRNVLRPQYNMVRRVMQDVEE
jgi:hypothetical protein